MTDTDELTALGEAAIEAFDGLLHQAKAEQPPAHPLACDKGCADCCHQPEVTVTAIEIFRIADYIRLHFTAEKIKSLAQIPASKLNPDRTFWILTACPLLIDGACSVYPVRGLVCRSANAYDASDCKRARQQNRHQAIIENYGPQERAAFLTLEALQQGIAAAGREAELLNLGPAIAIALKDPEAERRWQKGEQVFAAAHSVYGQRP